MNMVKEIMETKQKIAETSKMYCTVQITSEVNDVETEKNIAKIADAYKSMYNRASQTLDVSRIDSAQVTGLIDELKKANIQAKPLKSEMLESLHERMDKIVGKKTADSQPVDSQKKKKELDEEEPQEPVVQKENTDNIQKEFFDSGSARNAKTDYERLTASIAAELDAASLYKSLAIGAENENVRKLLLDVAHEEEVHVGEFELLLKAINPEYVDKVLEGNAEVKEVLGWSTIDSEMLLIGAMYELYNREEIGLFEAMKIAKLYLIENPNYYVELLVDEEVEESSEPGKEEDIQTMEYQTPGGSNINVGRMIKNMSRMKMPKFDSKRNLKDRFKIMFKMRSPKDDMNAAMNNNREGYKEENDLLQPGEWIESYTLVGKFEEEKEANDVLKALLNKKRNAQMLTDKDGKKVIVVEENYKEDNTMGNSKDIMSTKIPGKMNYVDTKKKAEEIIKKYKPRKDDI